MEAVVAAGPEREGVVEGLDRLGIGAGEIDRAAVGRVHVVAGVEGLHRHAVGGARHIRLGGDDGKVRRGAEHDRDRSRGRERAQVVGAGHRQRRGSRSLERGRELMSPVVQAVKREIGGEHGPGVVTGEVDRPAAAPVAVRVRGVDRERDLARDHRGRKSNDRGPDGVATEHVERPRAGDLAVGLVGGGQRLDAGRLEHRGEAFGLSALPGLERVIVQIAAVWVGAREVNRAGVAGVDRSVLCPGGHRAGCRDADDPVVALDIEMGRLHYDRAGVRSV